MTGNYNCLLTGLIPNTTYYLKGFSSSKLGVNYGNQISFTTAKTVSPTPIVTTLQVISIIPTSATVETTFDNINKATVLSAGVCILTNPNPSISESIKTILTDENYTTKKFTVDLSKLTPDTKQYIRSYIETSLGVFYGEIIAFTTKVS